MLRGGNKAFTIVEIIFFLAISSGLILIAMNSIGSNQQRVQFTDSMRGLESFIENQESATVNGVNDRPGNCIAVGGATDDSCIILGRVLVFNTPGTATASTVDYYTIIGDRLTADDEAACSNRLRCANPRVEDNTIVRSYGINWGAEFIGGKHNVAGGEVDSRAFGFIRDPRSSSISLITYSDAVQDLANDLISEQSTYNTGSTEMVYGNVEAYYCFASVGGGLDAVFVMAGSKVELVFDIDSEQYDC